MLNIFVCLFIPLAMALFVLEGKARKLIVFFLAGIFMCMFAGQINGLLRSITQLDTYTLTTSVTPVVEEIVKTIPIILLAFGFEIDRQSLLECSLMLGLGFATIENVYILISASGAISFSQAFSRGLGAAMLHATTSLIVSYGISLCKVRKKTFITGTYAMLIGAMVFHGIYNMLVQSDKFLFFGLLLPSLVFIPITIIIIKRRKKAQS